MRPEYIIVHHSFTPKDLAASQAESSFNNSHRDRGFPRSSMGWYLGYQYVIYGNGELRQYRRDDEMGAHVKEQSMNFKSIGICLSGNFDAELPNPAQAETLRQLIIRKMTEWGIPSANIFPHRKFAPYKSCYGTRLADDWAKNLVSINRQPAERRSPQMVIKKQGEPTLYLLEGDVAVAFSVDFASFQTDFGTATIVELPPAEFAKLRVSQMRIIKV